jgi:hypothetical protein
MPKRLPGGRFRRSDARYHSDACRKRADRISAQVEAKLAEVSA